MIFSLFLLKLEVPVIIYGKNDDIRIAHQFILASNHAIQPKLLETTTDDFLFFEVLLMLTWVRRENNVELQDWEDLAALK